MRHALPLVPVGWQFAVVAVMHLGLAGTWLGAMSYSLLIVQPRAGRFFGTDDDAFEAFLTNLGAGNRRPVVAIIAGLVVSGAALPILRTPATAQVALYVLEAVLLLAAALTFVHVSWRLWPDRIFALPLERSRHRAVLRRHAIAMVLLISAAFAIAVVNVAWR